MARANEHRPTVSLEADRIASVWIALLTVAVLALTAASALWPAVELERARRGARTGMPESGPSMILQELFPSPRGPAGATAPNWRGRGAALADAPGDWAWVDRDRGIAAIPIEEAMRLRAAGVRP